MVKKFEPTKVQQRALARALAVLDTRKRRAAVAATKKALAVRERRRAEKREARRERLPVDPRPKQMRRLMARASRSEMLARRLEREIGAMDDAESRKAQIWRKRAVGLRAAAARAREDAEQVLLGEWAGEAPAPAVRTTAERQILARPCHEVLQARVSDGAWYTTGEIVKRMPEYSRGLVKLWVGNLAKAGVLARAGHPDWQGVQVGTMRQVPRYLHRLAENRQKEARQWLRELGEG